jgi:L-fuculose-phosphate aldolase
MLFSFLLKTAKVSLEEIMDIAQFSDARNQVATLMSRLYTCRLTTTSGGNISLRLTDDLFCITPSKLDKAHLTGELIAVVTMDGENLTPHLPLSIESEMHRQALLTRKDMQAIVHAHPCYASAFTAVKRSINTRLLAETWFLLEEPAFAPYARMGTVDLADTVANCLKKADVILMENHGVLTVGKSLVEAFDLIEVLENSAKMTYITETLAATGQGWNTSSLDDERCEDLLRMKRGE